MAETLNEDRFGDPDEIREGINQAEHYANAKPLGHLSIRSVETGTRQFYNNRHHTRAIDTGRIIVSRHVHRIVDSASMTPGPENYLG